MISEDRQTLGSLGSTVRSFWFEKLAEEIFKAVFAVYFFFEACLKMFHKGYTYIF